MKNRIFWRLTLLMLLSTVAFSACAGANQTAATPTDAPPTVTPFPTFAFVEPTTQAVFDQSEEDAAAAGADESNVIALDPKLVERGSGRYVALDCGNCHGAGGQGTDQGPSLLEFDLSEDDFITFVRSGGDMGPDHQFSTDRLSNSGSRNLYQYLVSIAAAG